MIKKIYIGVDPDLRLINAAIVTDQRQALAVFKRSNKGFRGDKAVAQAVDHIAAIVDDIKDCIAAYAEHFDPEFQIIVVVESQNMEHARDQRKKGRKINYQNILQLGQISGIFMGALSVLGAKTVLLQAQEWKGTVRKDICHKRYYTALGLVPDPEGTLANIYPVNKDSLCYYSADKINPGDFMDINDSLGLALYGAKKGL